MSDFVLRRAILVAFATTMLLAVPVIAASSSADLKADVPISGAEPLMKNLEVCSSSSGSDNNSCANEDDSIQDAKKNITDSSIYEPPEIEWCRRQPLWRLHQENSEINCEKLIGYEMDLEALVEQKHPHIEDANYSMWKQTNSEDGPILDRPLLRTLSQCTEEILVSKGITANPTIDGTMRKASVSQIYRRELDQLAVMAIVENALSEEEAETVHALAECSRKHVPNLFVKREFGDTEEGGGNDCTYISGFLQILAPGVAYRIQNAARLVWQDAGWSEQPEVLTNKDDHALDIINYWTKNGYPEDYDEKKLAPSPGSFNYTKKWFPDPVKESGIRTTEHLSYDKWGTLGFHEDAGSDYTVLAALSDPEDYEGGKFSLCPDYNHWEHENGKECSNKISVKPNKLAAVVFLSEMQHGVEDILTPGRITFANELWRYGQVPAMMTRPTPSEFVFGIQVDDKGQDDSEDDDDDDDDEYEEMDDDEVEVHVTHQIRKCDPDTGKLVYHEEIDLFWVDTSLPVSKEGVPSMIEVERNLKPGEKFEDTLVTQPGHVFIAIPSSVEAISLRFVNPSDIVGSIEIEDGKLNYSFVGSVTKEEDCKKAKDTSNTEDHSRNDYVDLSEDDEDNYDDDQMKITFENKIRKCDPDTGQFVLIKEIDVFWVDPDEPVSNKGVPTMEVMLTGLKQGRYTTGALMSQPGHTFKAVPSSVKANSLQFVEPDDIVGSIQVKKGQKEYTFVSSIRTQEECDALSKDEIIVVNL